MLRRGGLLQRGPANRPEDEGCRSAMYRGLYEEMVADSAEVCRRQERAAFDRAIDLMASAGAADATVADRTEAVSFVQRLWKLLIDDLVEPENALPEGMRADLISVGLWIIRQSDRVLRGDAHGFDALITVNATIRDGLR